MDKDVQDDRAVSGQEGGLVYLYGICLVCGAPMNLHRFHETDAHGHESHWQRILCTKDPMGHYPQALPPLDPAGG